MSRYIDADALLTKFVKFSDAWCTINAFPTTNVVEVKHGEWLDHQNGKWIYAKCSLCETIHDTKTNFCPNCGAKMEVEHEAD